MQIYSTKIAASCYGRVCIAGLYTNRVNSNTLHTPHSV